MFDVPLPVDATRQRKSGFDESIGSAASQIALESSWNANSSRMRSPEKPRAVRGFAASTLMRPTLPLTFTVTSKRMSEYSTVSSVAAKPTASFATPRRFSTSRHLSANSAPLSFELESTVTRRPGRVRSRSTAQAASVKLLPIWRLQCSTSTPVSLSSKTGFWYSLNLITGSIVKD